MRVALIGFPNVGKTYWSRKLEGCGYKLHCCDELIEQKLKYLGVANLAKWMGQPYEPEYPQRSAVYLNAEGIVMRNILFEVRNSLHPNNNVVIDTTGSVIYLNPILLREMTRLIKVVYIKVSDPDREVMFNLFLKNPKPIIWGKLYRRNERESHIVTLRRCYNELLDFRAKKYEKIADTILDSQALRESSYSVNDLLSSIS